MTSVQRRARPWILLLALAVLAAVASAAVLLTLEWQRIEMERAVARATHTTKVRPYTPKHIALAVHKTIAKEGGTADPDKIHVTIENSSVADRPTAQLADGIRVAQAGRTVTVPIRVQIRAEAELDVLGWRKTVRIEAEHNTRVSPDLAPSGKKAVAATSSGPPQRPLPPPKPSMVKPGMETLFAVLNQTRASREPLKLDISKLRAHVQSGDLSWYPSPRTLRSFIQWVDALPVATNRRAHWNELRRRGQLVANKLADIGVYTPIVDPLSAPLPQ